MLEDPFEFPIYPMKLMQWIQERLNEKGHIRWLKPSRAMMNWICDIFAAPKHYKQDDAYAMYIKGLLKEYKEAPDERLPFTMNHIVTYIKSLISKINRS